jgi:hypothetical protein
LEGLRTVRRMYPMVIMLTLLNHMKKLPVGRVKNGEEDVSDGENVEDEGERQHRDEKG